MEPTTDVAFIRSIITDPDIFPMAVGEGTPADWQPNMQPPVLWLREEGAVFMLYPVNGVLWESHSAVLPAWRKHTRVYYRQVLHWLRQNTSCKHLIGSIPEGNWRAQRAAEAAGMQREGFLPKSRILNGSLVGLHLYGIEV